MARTDSETHKTDRQLLEEIAQRARRTETRVTKIAKSMGIDGGNDKPHIRDNTLYVPSPKTALEDILAVLRTYDGMAPVAVCCGNTYLATITA